MLTPFCFIRMGSKTQSENKKLNVPGAGTYNLPEKVCILSYNKLTAPKPLCRSLKVKVKPWVKRLESSNWQECWDQDQVVILSINKKSRTLLTRWDQNLRTLSLRREISNQVLETMK